MSKYHPVETPWADEETLREMYRYEGEDMSQRAIADELGCNRSTIKYYLNKYGIEKECPWRDKETLYTHYCEKGLTSGQLAELWDTSARTIREWCNRHDIETDVSGRSPQYRVERGEEPWDDEEFLRELYAERELGVYEIASLWDVEYATIEEHLYKYGLLDGKPWCCKETIQREHIDKGRSSTELAEEWDCLSETVVKYCREYDLDCPYHDESEGRSKTTQLSEAGKRALEASLGD